MNHQDFIKMKKNILLIIVLLLVQTTIAQKKTRADRFFEKGDYTNAAKYYEEEIAVERHKKAIENIATCYYNTFQYRKASRYLKQLVKGKFGEKDKSYANNYNFKLYQVLSALGDYETGLDYFKKYKEELSLNLDKAEAIETIEGFKLKNPDYTIKKAKFNSDAADFGAVKLKDSVYFTSDRDNKQLLSKKYKWTHRSFLDIYAVKVNEKLDTIGSVVALPKSINSKLHEGNFCFSKDGNTIYISKSNTDAGKKVFNDKQSNNIHLYTAQKTNGNWSELTKLSFCKNGFSYQHPALSNDGKKLYFSSNETGGFGSFDIYYVTKNNNTYGNLVNLGSTINTPNREHYPYISLEGNLFFSSNGHLGLGMLDVFVSEVIKDKFTTPINLGVPINSKYDDFNLNYFDKNKGFFASNRSKNDDIYQFTQTGEIFIREYINTFEIRDLDTKELIENTNVVLTDKKGNEIYHNTTAQFNANLLAGNYHLKATNTAYTPNNKNIVVIEKKEQTHVLLLKQLPPPPPPPPIDPIEVLIAEKHIDKKLKTTDPKRFEMLTDTIGPSIIEKDGKLFFKLKPIYFDFNMWNIRADSKLVLDELAKKLERYPNIHLKINSHTDSRGTVKYNQVLSERRAEATRNYLALEVFISARRFTFEGFGELQPIVPCPMLNCTEDEHQLNRRSEFEIVKY